MRKMIFAFIISAISGIACACPTNNLPACDSKLVDYTSVGEKLIADRCDRTDSVSWVHTINTPSGYKVDAVHGASLTITSQGVNNFLEGDDRVSVYFMNTYLGNLKAGCLLSCSETTSFDLGSYFEDGKQVILDQIFSSISAGTDMEVTAELKFVSNFLFDSEDWVKICQSKLTVCLSQSPIEDSTGGEMPAPAVPAPGAVLLSGAGTALAGLVRRRSL